MRVLAIVGLSGVGKTTLLKQLAERHSFLHLQASELIKAGQQSRGSSPSTSEQLREGPVLHNQSQLISGFMRATEGYDGLVVFDGHVLIDTDSGIVEIPGSVYESIGCAHIAVVTDSASELVRRRAADRSRERPTRSAVEINEQQERILNVARQIAADLHVQCSMHSVGHSASIENLIERMGD